MFQKKTTQSRQATIDTMSASTFSVFGGDGFALESSPEPADFNVSEFFFSVKP